MENKDIPPANAAPAPRPASTIRFALFALALTACFALPLTRLVRYSLNSEFFSYIPLIPAIIAYLIFIQRKDLPPPAGHSWLGAGLCAAIGFGLLALYFLAFNAAQDLEFSERLAFLTGAYLSLLVAGAFYLLGPRFMRSIAFPVAFSAFIIPPPPYLLDPVTAFMQTTSAWMAHVFFKLAWTHHVKDGLVIHLSNISLLVAPECSGIHSTMVLLLTSLLAGRLFLRSRWHRAWLALAVVPLAIARNGFRVFTLGELCVHISRSMIDSPIHHQGGPIFFALSLIPFFLLLAWLRRLETRRPPAEIPAS